MLGFLAAGATRLITPALGWAGINWGSKAASTFGSRIGLSPKSIFNFSGVGQVASTLSRFTPLFTGYAMLTAADSLRHWANTNVSQTGTISEDAAKQLALSKERFEFEKYKWLEEQEQREEDYERSMEQTAMIEAFDQQGRQFQANMQMSQMNFDMEMYNAKQQQLLEDRNTYLMNQMFQTKTGGQMALTDDRFTIAFILSEIQNLILSKQPINQDPQYYEPSNEFDENYFENNYLDDYIEDEY